MMKRYNDYIKRTALDYEYREECARKAEYYKLWNNQTAKYSEWTGPQYYELRARKEQAQKEQEERRLNLTLRRQHLAEKLRQETLQHSNELRDLRKKGPPSMNEIRLRHNELQEKLDSDLRSEAELQLYHQWRRDEPAIRLAESQYRKGFSRQAWAKQVEAKMAADEAKKAEMDRLHQEQSAAALREAQAERLAEQLRREEECRVAQLNAEEAQDRLRANAHAAEELRQEEASAARLEQELFRLEQERAQQELHRSRAAYRAGLDRQAEFHLHQRALEVQRELEEDQELLRRVHQAMEKEEHDRADRRQARLELAAKLRTMAEQAKREAAMAKLNANIFHEEALVELRVQEERWQKERAARRKLLASVLAEQQAQARAVREKATSQRRKLQEECEELRLVTEHNELLQRARDRQQAEQQREYKLILEQQMAEKEAYKQQQLEEQRREEAVRRKKAAEEAARLDQELRKIMLGQQKVAWL